MSKQILFKALLGFQTILVGVYTLFAFKNEGAGLFSIFLGNLQAINWNGQFSLDFSSYLTLSGLWIAWRNKFSTSALVFSTVAAIVGIIAFSPYLLYLLWKEKGDLKKVLVGEN